MHHLRLHLRWLFFFFIFVCIKEVHLLGWGWRRWQHWLGYRWCIIFLIILIQWLFGLGRWSNWRRG